MFKIFLNLGMQPMANKYLRNPKDREFFYSLKVGFNFNNYLVSITKNIKSKKIYNNKYPYLSSASKTMQKSFSDLAKKIKKNFGFKKILEIGSNDGAFIKNFSKDKIASIEPCENLAKVTKKMGYKTYPLLWNTKTSNFLKKNHGKFNLVYSANTLSHIYNLNDVFKSINNVLDDNGILIIEDPSLYETIKNTSYDQFYNEHVYVFSLLALEKYIKKFELEIFNCENLNTHGGSLRYYIKRKNNKKINIKKNVANQKKREIKLGLKNFSTYVKFRQKVLLSKKKLKNLIINIKKNQKKIIGYGSTAKSCTVLNFCKINNKHIDFFYDTTPLKTNKFTPGTHIYVKKYKKNLSIKDCDYVFLGAWNFKKEIFNKEKKFIKQGGKFITHVPFPRIINK